jgi:hypothetical protein
MVNFYNYDFATEMPADILAIEGKDSGARTEEEKKRVEAHYTTDVKLLASIALESGVYALRYRPDGAAVAVAGEDGKVRFISTSGSQIVKEFVPVPISTAAATITAN